MVEPKTKADQDKMGIGLQKLAEEDPTFRVEILTLKLVKQLSLVWATSP